MKAHKNLPILETLSSCASVMGCVKLEKFVTMAWCNGVLAINLLWKEKINKCQDLLNVL